MAHRCLFRLEYDRGRPPMRGPARLRTLGTLPWVVTAALFGVACGTGSAAPNSTAQGPRDAGGGGASGASGQPNGGAETGGSAQVDTGGAAGTGSVGPVDAATGCNANRGTGIPVNSGTLSANVDSVTLSGPGRILWAAGTNTLTLQTVSDGALTVIFPGCEVGTYSVPGTGPKPDPISVTYTASGGDPQWACTYEDTNLGPATCVVDVTAYGDQQNSSVTGTFHGTLRLRRGTGATTKTVTAGTFTFGRP